MTTEIGYQHILIPLDGSAESEAIFPYVVPIATQFHSRVTLVEVLTTVETLVMNTSDLTGGVGVVDPAPIMEADKKTADSYLAQAAKRLAAMGVTVDARDPEGAAVSTIFEVAKQLEVDLIAMATHARSGFQKFVFGSMADDVLHGTPCPLLLVRIDKPA